MRVIALLASATTLEPEWEFMRLRLPFRADSLPGLIHTAPGLIGGGHLARLGVTLHAFTVRGSTVPSGAH
jgi:hypothetical protein